MVLKVCLTLFFVILLGKANAEIDWARWEAESKPKWVPLFNGRDLDGWTPIFVNHPLGENPGRAFRVVDGVLTVSYADWDTYNKTVGTLLHEKEFSHYVLRARYRFTGNQLKMKPKQNRGLEQNNGLMLHCQPPQEMARTQKWPVSYEVQLRGDIGPDFPLTTSNICTLGLQVINESGGGLGGIISSNLSGPPLEEWTEATVVVRGDKRVEHYVNGQLVNVSSSLRLNLESSAFEHQKYSSGQVIPRDRGLIGIQAESHPTEFSSIEIVELSPDDVLPRKRVGFSRPKKIEAVNDGITLLPIIEGAVGVLQDSGELLKIEEASVSELTMPRAIGGESRSPIVDEYLQGRLSANKVRLKLSQPTERLPVIKLPELIRDRYGAFFYVKDQSDSIVVRDHLGVASEFQLSTSSPLLAIALIEDQNHLLAARSRGIDIWEVNEGEILPNHAEPFFTAFLEGESITCSRIVRDTNQNFILGTTHGILVLSSEGDLVERLTVPSAVSSICFGGEDYRTLFLLCEGQLYQCDARVRGLREVTAIIHIPSFQFFQEG